MKGSSRDPRLRLDPLKEVRRGYIKSPREPNEIHDPEIALTPFYPAYVGPMKPRLMGQLFLRHSFGATNAADIPA